MTSHLSFRGEAESQCMGTHNYRLRLGEILRSDSPARAVCVGPRGLLRLIGLCKKDYNMIYTCFTWHFCHRAGLAQLALHVLTSPEVAAIVVDAYLLEAELQAPGSSRRRSRILGAEALRRHKHEPAEFRGALSLRSHWRTP